MGDIEGGGPPSPRRGFSLPSWLNPRERRRSAAAANVASQAPGLPSSSLFHRISAVPEESHRGEHSRTSNGEDASSGGSTPRHAAAAADGYPSLGRKAKIPSSSTTVLGPRDPFELLPRSSNADGGVLPEQLSSTSAASAAAVERGSGSNLAGSSTTSLKAGSTGRPSSTGRRSERPAGADAAGSVASNSRASLGGVSAQPTARALGDVVFGRQSMAVKVSEEATKKYMHMAEADILEQQTSETAQRSWGRGVIHPLDRRYRIWWYVTVFAAAVTGWLIPFRMAYMSVGYDNAHVQGATVLEILLSGVFGLDILVSFFVGFYDSHGLLVMQNLPVALFYIRHRLLVDVITTVPFDAIVLAALRLPEGFDSRYVALLGLLKLGRMYRVMVMFRNMSFNLNLGLLALTLLRNFTLCFYLLHWAACGFWYIALQEGHHDMTWVAQEAATIQGKGTVDFYIFSFYWAIVTFATLGYGDVTPSTTPEIVFTIVYVAINVVVWAYVLGTITLLVTKQDEETGQYRQRMAALNTYCTANNLSADLKHTMAGLLRLHMSLSNEALGDEQVLAVYPTTIRRKILRQLYATPLHECYLFKKCGVKFLDALMLGARVELFLPKVEIVSSLDHVNELYIVMAGHVELVPPSSYKDGGAAVTSGGGASTTFGSSGGLGSGGGAAAVTSSGGASTTFGSGGGLGSSGGVGNGGGAAAATSGGGASTTFGSSGGVGSGGGAAAVTSGGGASATFGSGGGVGSGGGAAGSAAAAADAANGKHGNAQSYQVISNPLSWSRRPAAAAAAATNASKPSGNAAAAAAAADGAGGGWLHSSGISHAEAIRQTSASPGAASLPRSSQELVKTSSNKEQQQQQLGRRSSKLQRAWSWMTDRRQGSYSKGHAQLQEDRQALNKVSTMALARASRALGPGPLVAGSAAAQNVFVANTAQFPAAAMRGLDTRSRLPLALISAASSTAGSGAAGPAGAAGAAAAAQAEPALEESDNPMLGPGDCFAEVAYFTEVPKAEAVRSLTVCRVLVIPRSTYNAVARDFPLSARQVLENLKSRAAEMVAAFLPPELAREVLRQADLSSSGPTAAAREDNLPNSPKAAAAAAAVAGTGKASAERQQSSPFADLAANQSFSGPGVAQQQQQHKADASIADSAPDMSSRSKLGGAAAVPGDLRSVSDSGGSGAAGGQQQQLRPGGTAGRDRSRPVLSSMSVQLQSRYYSSPGNSRRSFWFEDPASATPTAAAAAGSPPAAAAAGVASLEASRQARALNRFTSLSKQQRAELEASSVPGSHATNISTVSTSSSLEGVAEQWEGGGGADAAQLARTSGPAGRGAAAAAASVPGSAAGGRGPGGLGGLGSRSAGSSGQNPARSSRALGTMSLSPFHGGDNARMARVMEGMAPAANAAEQQRAARLAAATAAFDRPAGAFAAAAAAGGGGGGGPPDKQQQLQLQLAGAGGSKKTNYSDDQLQAAAAAASAGLTMQQQRLLADLLRLRQLVNKAAAKFDQQRLTAFLDAAAAGEVEVVQDMLRQGMSPNTADYDGRTALMVAAYRGHKDIVLNLLFVGADTRLKDARGFDVMVEAARGGHADVIDVLTRGGAKAGISGVLQAQLLCKATYEGKLDRLSNLLRAGCQADAHDYDGQTALHVAAADANLPAARLLVSAGGAITLKDRWGYSPLELAHKVGAAPLVEFFESVVPPEVAAAAAENWKRERTEAALAAVRYGDAAALARLLQRGCPVDAADYDGRTLLHVAVTNKQQAIVSQLLSAGANPNATNSAGSSPLLEAAMNGSSGIQAALMAAGARLNLPPTEEAALLSSVLHMARHDQLLALLAAGANPAAADYDSRTPLHIAASVGANPAAADYDSRTPLHIAASVGDVRALRLLADAVADASIERLQEVQWDAKDRWGDTPLQEALRAGHMEAAAFLQEMEQQHKAALAAVSRSTSLPADTAAAAAAAASGAPAEQQQQQQPRQLSRAFQSLQGERRRQPAQQQQQQQQPAQQQQEQQQQQPPDRT
uniref:Cyclic nucleotide-binding domain-containing protein n=1 Tax=Tetradesmus obliquus TaxID=3088 RepID=A0A383VF86_TETOB|eukprot:jgi/Sobl393_1/8460/SZX63402.1